MDDERYVGTVRGIITDKRRAMDYVDAMVDHFGYARNAGYGASKTSYAVYFEKVANLLTPTKRTNWHITQVTNLMEVDSQTVARRVKEIKKFSENEAYFRDPRRYKEVRKVTDEQWIELRSEYFDFLDANAERAKLYAARIRGDTLD